MPFCIAQASLGSEQELLQIVMNEACAMTCADRCSIFLVDYENRELEAHFDQQTAIRMPMTSGVAGYVATNETAVNLPCAYDHEQFNRTVDELTGYKTQSLLCVPVYYERSLVAVAQLVNKKDKDGNVVPFTEQDQALLLSHVLRLPVPSFSQVSKI